ncbi:MAG TPA: dephospho-CoA kinase, partial [Clostridiales bacterium]|nr:dephospho-CoA kinase [Clostridiales bacterium]
MSLIGLCGRSGSGKSECGQFIENMGFRVIDSDRVYRSLTLTGSPMLRELTSHFGKNILDTNGGLDRKKLSEIVFDDDDKLELLNRITHKRIIAAVLDWSAEVSAASTGGFAVVQAPLLFESGLNEKCAITVCVIAPEEDCIRRLVERDGLSRERAELRLKKQKISEFLKR